MARKRPEPLTKYFSDTLSAGLLALQSLQALQALQLLDGNAARTGLALATIQTDVPQKGWPALIVYGLEYVPAPVEALQGTLTIEMNSGLAMTVHGAVMSFRFTPLLDGAELMSQRLFLDPAQEPGQGVIEAWCAARHYMLFLLRYGRIVRREEVRVSAQVRKEISALFAKAQANNQGVAVLDYAKALELAQRFTR